MTHKEIKGVLPVVLMPYTEAGGIDEDGFFLQTEHMLSVGCDGFVVGQVSELLRLTTAERFRLSELCAKAAEGGGVSVMSTGGESTEAAVEFSRQAQDAGVDALLVMHPATVALDDDQMVRYFSGVVEAVEIPVMVHHAKSFAKQPLSIEAQARLLDEYGPERVLFKPEASPTAPRVSALRDRTGGRARIFEGDGGMMLIDCYRRGLAGTIPATEIADIVAVLWRLLEAGEDEKIRQLGHGLAYLMCHMMNSVDCYVTIAKHLLKQRGLIRNTLVRGPSSYPLDEETRAEIDRTYGYLLDLVKEFAR